MKLEYETTHDDCLAAMLETTKRTRAYEHWLFFWRWGFASAALVLTIWLLWSDLGLSSFLVGAGVATMVLQLMPGILRRRTIARIREQLADPQIREAWFGKRTLEVLPDGLRVTGPHHEIHYKWALVDSIERQESRVFVSLKGVVGIAICASAAEADALIASARAMREGHQATQ